MHGLLGKPPHWVERVLATPALWFLARLGLVSAYLIGGASKLFDFPAAVAEQAHFGMHPPAFWAGLTIGVELVGSLLILWGRLVWFAAGMLGCFTVLAAYVANDFWAMPAGARFAATNSFFEHMGLVGGFVFLAIVSDRSGRHS